MVCRTLRIVHDGVCAFPMPGRQQKAPRAAGLCVAMGGRSLHGQLLLVHHGLVGGVLGLDFLGELLGRVGDLEQPLGRLVDRDVRGLGRQRQRHGQRNQANS